MDEVDDLTPTAQDYLKVIWSAVEWGEPPITTKGLAATFATTQANVSDTMRRLDAQGLLIYEPYKPVALTELGQRLAVQMVRRHRLIETFLSEALGYGPDEGHDDAERLEHAVSDKLLGRIDRLLGHPDTDPHGDPIPGDDGGWRPRTDTTPKALYSGIRLSITLNTASCSATSITWPLPPLTLRWYSAVSTPMVPCRAASVSPIETPTRTGTRPGSPVRWRRPPMASPIAPKPGRSR